MSEFPDLSPAQIELLALLAEECAEVIQACTKILRHGLESGHPGRLTSNQGDLNKEIGHLKAALELTLKFKLVDPISTEYCKTNKLATIQRYLHHNQI